MNDFLKLAIAAPFVVFCIASFVAWMNRVLGWGDVCFPILAVIAFLPVRWSFSRVDKAPDFLVKYAGPEGYFERRGVCFTIRPGLSDGHAYLDIHFQNRFARPCVGGIVLLPTAGFFRVRPRLKLPPISIECPGGAFGIARIWYSLPEEYQGRIQSFDVFGKAKYPRGRGTRLRFTEACHVGGAGFDGWSIMALFGALGGAILLTKAARIKFLLPNDVSGSEENCPPAELKILRRPDNDFTIESGSDQVELDNL